uniref:Lrp/AsnC family transcriptional regulator n=1 Tax=Pseudonocardia pini TaxID=2758030 RepID=UPI0028A5A1CE
MPEQSNFSSVDRPDLKLDSLDLSLLGLLQNDARLTNRQLAAQTGVAPSTSLERVRGLLARGVISGYHADVDLPSVGR